MHSRTAPPPALPHPRAAAFTRALAAANCACRRQLRAPPQDPHIHTFKSSSKCSTANPFEGKGVLPTPHGHMSHTVTLPLVHTTTLSTHNRQHKSIKCRRIPHAIVRLNGGCLLTFPPHQKLELREVLGLTPAKIGRQPHPTNKLALLAPADDLGDGT